MMRALTFAAWLQIHHQRADDPLAPLLREDAVALQRSCWLDHWSQYLAGIHDQHSGDAERALYHAWDRYGAALPMTTFGAWIRLQGNSYVRQALRLEPQVTAILLAAAAPLGAEARAVRYVALKREVTQVVGWFAPRPRVRTMQHYDALIRAIDDLLPPDLDADEQGQGGWAQAAIDGFPEGSTREELFGCADLPALLAQFAVQPALRVLLNRVTLLAG